MTSLSPVRPRPSSSAAVQLPASWATITIVLSVAVALVSFGAIVPPPRFAISSTTGPSIRLDPAEGLPGTQVRVRGRGFPAKGRLQLTWDGSSAGMPVTASTGSLQATFAVPPVAAGPHAVGVTDASGVRLATASFIVDAPAPRATPGPTATVAPAPTAPAPPSTAAPTSPTGPIASPTPAPAPTGSASPAPGSTPTPTPGVTPTPRRAATSSPTPLPASTPGTTAIPTARPTPTPTRTPTATPTPTPAPTTSPVAAGTVRWALIGNDGAHLAAERAAGLTTKVFELGWSSYETSNGVFNGSYITAKRNEAAALRAAGFTLILSLGVQYTPSWMMGLPNAFYVNQYGSAYNDTSSGSGRANLIWNDDLRSFAARYISRVFADLGTDWAAVRIGGGRYGEIGYPVATYGSATNTYWAFDANAARTDPVPGWKPGMASPNGEASKFAGWYMDRLANYVAWQASIVRAHYSGRLMALFPSFGIRPGQLAAAISGNLSGATSAEKNGEVPRGYDYARQAKALSAFSGVVLTTTWLDCPYGSDASSSPVDWRPVHYLAYLAGQYGMARYGENTGQGSASTLSFTAAQAKTYGLLGFAWFNESEVLGGSYATLSDLARVIAAN